MSAIPSYITNITSGIYGSSYEQASIVEQFRFYLGLSPEEEIPDTQAAEESYIAFLARRASLLHYISTLSKQILGSAADVEQTLANFRSYLGLSASDPLPATDETKAAFLDYLARGNETLLFIAAITKDVYGSGIAAVDLLEGYRNSLSLVGDLPIPNTSEARAAFISYLATQNKTVAFISEFTKLITGSDITEARLASFRSYLGLEEGDPLPDEFATRSDYISFLGLEHDFATYAAANVKRTYGTSIIQNVDILAEFRASLLLDPNDAIAPDADTKRAFLYFLTSPTITAAHSVYGISKAAADSLRLFRATIASLDPGVPLPTNEETCEQYQAFVAERLDIAKFIQDATIAITGAPLTNELLAKFRAYLGLQTSDPIADDEVTKAHYMSFLHAKLAAVGKSEAANAISPHEDAVRRVLFSAFSMVLEMLTTLQQTARLESKAIQIYSEWEKEYTNLIAATPIYGPTSLNQIIANNNDFGSTTLGQEGITIRQVADWLLNEIQTKGTSSATFNVTNPVHDDPGFPCFIMEKNSDGSYTFRLRAPQRDGWGGFANNWQNILSVTITPSSTLIGQEQNRALIDNMMTAMTTKWQNNAFDRSSFGVYAKVYDRKSTGDKKEIGDLYQSGVMFKTFLTSDLKTLWSGRPNTIEYVDHQFTRDGGPYNRPAEAFHGWFGQNQASFTVNPSLNQPINILVNNNLPTGVATNSIALNLGTIQGGDYDGGTFGIYLQNQSEQHPNYYSFAVYIRYRDDGQQKLKWAEDAEEWFYSKSMDLSSTISTGFWGPWNAPGIGAWPETVPYPSNYSKTSLQNVRSQASSYIGEINAQLQQYVQVTQARKENIDNARKLMQNLLSQTLQATSNQMSLLDAIVQTLKSILTSIFH